MHEIIGGIEPLAGRFESPFVEDIALNDLGAGKSAREAFGIAGKTPNGVTGFE
jgi:hypothetical protein